MGHNTEEEHGQGSEGIAEVSEGTIEWIKQQVAGSVQVIHIHPLKGGISSAVYAVHIQIDGETIHWVMRQYTDKEWLSKEPDLAVFESEALQAARTAGISSPKWIAADFRGDYCGHPTVLMSKVPGEVDLRPKQMDGWISKLAEALANLHSAGSKTKTSLGRGYRTYNQISDLKAPDWSSCPSAWERIISILKDPESIPTYTPKLIHRDYHPANVLWNQGKVSAVVDWVNACMGPAGIDTGHCRLNLVQLYGVQAADDFLAAYLKAPGGCHEAANPYWDMLSLIEILPGPPEVYRGWTDLGYDELSPELIAERLDEYAESLLNR
ncbi:homoserine kinase [compost metagenome]